MKRLCVPMLLFCLAACESAKPPPAPPTPMASSFDLPASQEELQKRVALGDADAAGRLARYYSFIERDENKALVWYQKAAELGGAQERMEYESYKEALNEYFKAVPTD